MTAFALVEPAYRSQPDYYRTLGGEVADLCDLADFAPDPEQKLGLDLLFAFDRQNRAAAFEFAVICPRQNLKTGLFKQAALGWLFLTEQRLIVWSAHEFNTAAEAHRDMAVLIENTSFLSKRLKRVYSGSADKSIELKSGQRLIFKARTHTGGRGLSGDKVVLDEAFALRPWHMGALLPTLSVRPDPQVVYGSSAGLADSDVLRAIRDRGRAGTSARLAYLEWAAKLGGCEVERCTHALGMPGCALDRVENWQQANSLLGRTRANGTGLTLEYVQAEREALSPDEFGRERMGRWDEPGASEIFGAGKWEACAGEGQPAKVGALAVAVSMDLSHAAIVAAATDGRTFVKPLDYRPGTSWAAQRLKELQKRHGVPVVVAKDGPAAALIPDLKAAGVRLHVCTASDALDAWDSFYKLVTSGLLKHPNYPELNAAVNAATTKLVGDRPDLARRTSAGDISVAEAAKLAAWWASRPRRVPPPPNMPTVVRPISVSKTKTVQHAGF